MGNLPRRPWADIPWKHKSLGDRIYTIVSTLIFMFSFFYIAIVGLLYVREKNIKKQQPQDAIAVLIDTSLSMASADVKPNRYEQSLQIATSLISKIDATYMTIPYAGIPILHTPISTDAFGINQVLSQYTLGSYHVSQSYLGSAPGDAIGLARDLLSKIPAKRKTILLIGDLNSTKGFSIDAFIPRLQKDNIQLLVCAIGDIGYTIGVDHNGNQIISERNVSLLDEVTSQTKGKWRVCNDTNESIRRIAMHIKDTTIYRSNQNFSFAQRLWENDVLHVIAIVGIAYYVLISLFTLVSRRKNE